MHVNCLLFKFKVKYIMAMYVRLVKKMRISELILTCFYCSNLVCLFVTSLFNVIYKDFNIYKYLENFHMHQIQMAIK